MWKWPFSDTESTVDIAEDRPVGASPATTEVKLKPAPLPSSGPAGKPQLNDAEREEYVRVCREVGFECGDLVRDKLLEFLREENIHVFNYTQVVTYLDEKLGGDWEWRGLRQADVDHLGATKGWHTTLEPRHVYFAERPYRGAVPLPVLLTIQKVQKAVPEVFFYISAPKGNDGDPFLMITTQWMSSYVIERWDEPNFRER